MITLATEIDDDDMTKDISFFKKDPAMHAGILSNDRNLSDS